MASHTEPINVRSVAAIIYLLSLPDKHKLDVQEYNWNR